MGIFSLLSTLQAKAKVRQNLLSFCHSSALLKEKKSRFIFIESVFQSKWSKNLLHMPPLNLNSSKIYGPSFSMPLVFLDFAANEHDKKVLKHDICILQNGTQPSP
jgi:hypothetical protein